MENLNRGRTIPGMDSIQEAPKRAKRNDIQCPFGLSCDSCMIALNIDGKLKCSISVLAAEALKTGIKIGTA